jgi:hypothetical protein
MEYAKLGNSGMDVSRICLGCMGFGDAERGVHKWVLNDESSQPIIKKALSELNLETEMDRRIERGRGCRLNFQSASFLVWP